MAEWHKFPLEKPKEETTYLVTLIREGETERQVVFAKWFAGAWCDILFNCRVLAWAEIEIPSPYQ